MTAFIEETSNRLLPRIVLIACGSFSPPTPMHFRMFEIAKDHFEMQGTHKVIGGIVSPTHDAYGKKGLASGKHRCAMVKLALQTSPWIRLSDWETQQEGWSRTHTVLQYHQNFMNNFINSPDLDNMNNGGEQNNIPAWLPTSLRERRDPVQLKLLCGADLLESFAVPGLWLEDDIEDIISNHGLVVISRSGSNAEKFIFESDILTKYQRNIHLVTNWVSNEVSSTMIRRLLSRGQSVKYLIDDLVLEYIKQFALFQTKTKYITSLTRPTKQSNIFNIAYINQQNQQNVNMQLSSNETTPSDDDDDEEHMDETDFALVKTIIHSNNLDNRKVAAAAAAATSNVFCCGDKNGVTGVGIGVLGKLLGQGNKKTATKPGQAVQVITNECGVTEILEGEKQAKKIKVADNV